MRRPVTEEKGTASKTKIGACRRLDRAEVRVLAGKAPREEGASRQRIMSELKLRPPKKPNYRVARDFLLRSDGVLERYLSDYDLAQTSQKRTSGPEISETSGYAVIWGLALRFPETASEQLCRG